MKIRVLVAFLALACGSAFAAQPYSEAADEAANRHQSTATSTDTQPKKGGLIDKTKNAMHRMGDKIRHAMHRDKNTAAKSDTRSMGAAGSATQEQDRQQRMDDAYANWKSKQKS